MLQSSKIDMYEKISFTFRSTHNILGRGLLFSQDETWKTKRKIISKLFTYDLIISNPAYVDAPSVAALPEEYLHEPPESLGSGEDGLDVTRQILEQATTFLNPHGVLVVEIGHNRDVLEVSYPQLPFYWLDTASGDGFVFLLTREMLVDAGF